MNRPLVVVLTFVALATFTGLGVAQQERKAAGKPAAVPKANKVTLSADSSIASTKGCPAKAWVGFNQQPLSDYEVTFVPVNGILPITGNPRTNAKGELPVVVRWNTQVRAQVDSPPLVKSDVFKCGSDPSKKD